MVKKATLIYTYIKVITSNKQQQRPTATMQYSTLYTRYTPALLLYLAFGTTDNEIEVYCACEKLYNMRHVQKMMHTKFKMPTLLMYVCMYVDTLNVNLGNG